jgi:hypothetical protein
MPDICTPEHRLCVQSYDTPACGKRGPKGYYCTREPNHPGDCVACVIPTKREDGHNLPWDEVKPGPELKKCPWCKQLPIVDPVGNIPRRVYCATSNCALHNKAIDLLKWNNR